MRAKIAIVSWRCEADLEVVSSHFAGLVGAGYLEG